MTTTMQRESAAGAAAAKRVRVDSTIVELARFRYALRRFLRFSERAAVRCGVTPQQHQLMLGVAGFTGRGSATVSELAEFLQERVHSVVELVERAERHGLVRSKKSSADRRVVVVSLSRQGMEILRRLTGVHREQAQNLGSLLSQVEIAASSSARAKTQANDSTE